ncbi:two-component system response regulator [Kineobactrum sediminis]|uniref:cyclic-guanylate-specific phosphodiesterase n=1 Tax=Kineobactrum sediminis TaxID=1905677 RepID=A0A2N5Y6H6_9GAMM|nr:EAL domain-containing protein [Kineobactrum sediminis]PLW84003.1 two-component system response regulator [Kineobactrum sediminis]
MTREPASGQPTLRLHEFLRGERETILRKWEDLDRSMLAATKKLTSEQQRNNIPTILDTIAEHAEQAVGPQAIIGLPEEGPVTHARQRWELGFSLEDATREYSMLRTVIMQQLAQQAGTLSADELIFLHEALDDAVIQSVVTYVERSNRALEKEREQLQVTLRSIDDGVISTDTRGCITYMNPAAEKISGWTSDAAMGQPADKVLVVLDAATREPVNCLVCMAADADQAAPHDGEVLLQQRDGALLAVEEFIAPLRDSAARFIGLVATFRDVSKIRALTAELGYLATHDPLTNLPNRSLLIDRLTQEIAHAERNPGRLALLYMDLDLFKDVNDMLGHAAGDELLKQVAKRLQVCVRRADTVCRLGGDEFVILLTDFGELADLNELALKIMGRVRAPYDIARTTVELSTSLGVSVFPEDGTDPQALIKHADIAMYQAKRQGRNTIRFFAPEMHRRAAERRELQGDLRKALEAGQLSLHFQPQVALDSGNVVGVEVLLRWHHPQLGAVPPNRFIPLAEDNRNVMIALGRWVLEQASRQARSWLDAGYPALRISVNVSIVQLRDEHFTDHVRATLEHFRLPPDQLQLELTESLLMTEFKGAADRVRAIERLGVRIAVDDFGTGYSSLSYLKNLPVDELKIDQSFVHNIAAGGNAAPIVEAIIRMGQSLRLRVVAEGVEDYDTARYLTAHNCDCAQGFYYSKPLPATDFEREFLRPLGG